MCPRCAEKKSIYLPQLATVNKTEMLNETEIYLHLAMDDKKLDYKPGQFVEVSIPGYGEAPISISSAPTEDGSFELVVRRIGNVTNAIHKLQPQDKIGIRGPFGNGMYPVDETKGKNLVFICGGIGLVPQRSFINYALQNRDDYGDISILFGAKSTKERLFIDELKSWGKRDDVTLLETIDIAEQSWSGTVGVITVLIPEIEDKFPDSYVFVCGPPIMYKFVLLALSEVAVPKERIFLNLERKMKCGVGKCGHCQINNYYACMDGPVFRFADITSIPEAI
ncbi:MAG: FAD/NAD(P)-binding protein [Planctomycetota bacterium]|jgi:NAD(P)H-flavin reductase